MPTNYDIGLDGLAETMAETLGRMLAPEAMARMNREIAFAVAEMIADHLARASVSRHKTADRLGAPHTGFLEFAPNRVSPGVDSPSRAGGAIKQYSTAERAIVTIVNTPGLSRAFHPLHIVAKGKALTIPIHRVAYARRAAELRSEGWNLFRISTRGGGPGGGILFGRRGGQVAALYLLRKSVTVPQDEGLMPTKADIEAEAMESAEAFIETEAL